MEFDDIFQYIGDFGTYQLILFLTLGLTSFYPGWQNMGMAILGASMDHWCEVEELQGLPYEEQKRAGIPCDPCGEDAVYSECYAYSRDFTNYTDEQLCYGDFSNLTTETYECSSWTYDRTEFSEFPVSKFDLVCDDTYLISLSSTIYLTGMLVGAPASGVLSDKFGRFPIMMGATVGHLLFATLAAYSPDYWSFTMMRFMVSVTAHCAYLCAFVILMEITGRKYRSVVGCLFQMHFSFGYMMLPVMAYFVRDSSKLLLCMAMPVAVSLFFPLMISESPRWLVNQERYEEAEEVLTFVADVNRVKLPEKMDFTEDVKKIEKGKFMDLFKHKVLRNELLIIYLGWFCNSLLYYGLGLNAGTLAGSIFVNVFIGGAVEIPAVLVCIWSMQYYGRRPTLAWGFVVAAAANFMCIPFLNNEDLAILVTLFSTLGKACIKLTFTVIYVYTAELFPTPVRHLAVGSSSMMSRFGGILAPFMGGPLMEVWEPLPSIIFGAVALVSGLLSFFLPETLGKEMPDTFEEAITIGTKLSGVSIDIDEEGGHSDPRPSSGGDVKRIPPNKVGVSEVNENNQATDQTHHNGIATEKSNENIDLDYDTPYQNAVYTSQNTEL